MEAGRNPFDVSVDVELRGLSIYTHHGVSEAEQEIGQRLEGAGRVCWFKKFGGGHEYPPGYIR